MRKALLSTHARRVVVAAISLIAIISAVVVIAISTPAFSPPDDANTDAALLDAYRHVEVASVSDAMEKLTGQRIYLSHRMHPIFISKFAGLAVTVKLKKEDALKYEEEIKRLTTRELFGLLQAHR